MITRVVDETQVFAQYVAGRRVAYLDTNLWIALTYVRSAAAASCLAACRTLKREDRAIFPVSRAAVSELVEQKPGPAREARATLMDELSAGLCFREALSMRRSEAARAAAVLRGDGATLADPRTEAFTFVGAWVGDWEVNHTDVDEATLRAYLQRAR